ncbi:MAG: SsrA-binding protein SmpB [Candidatus Colwellbacteria bacterium]|nr:SsrA-binding protein SmpB [Candidatus Colwellbacteria bacterium]
MAEIARNKRAYFDYEILEKFEAGIELLGLEVKSVKSGRVNLASAYAVIKNNQVLLIGADIPPYQPNNTPSDYDSQRTRKLLLTADEIKALIGKTKESHLTILPLRVYTKGRLVKIELGLGKHKKKYDKRESIKKREAEREIKRSLKK